LDLDSLAAGDSVTTLHLELSTTSRNGIKTGRLVESGDLIILVEEDYLLLVKINKQSISISTAETRDEILAGQRQFCGDEDEHFYNLGKRR